MAQINLYKENSVFMNYDYGPAEQRIRDRVRELELELEDPRFQGTYHRFGERFFPTNFGYEVNLKKTI